MKIYSNLGCFAIGAALIAGLLPSCKKESGTPSNTSLTIVNAVTGSNNLITNFLSQPGNKTTDTFMWYSTALQIGSGSVAEIGIDPGITHLSVSQSSDTLSSIFSLSLQLKPAVIYSLFLIGSDTAQVDTLLTTDNVPSYPYTGDSVTGVRFVNLVMGWDAINVDIQGTTPIPVISSLPYKGVTGFKAFAADGDAQSNGYIFEFRDAVSDSVVAVWPLYIIPFKSQTLAIYGSLSAGLSVIPINEF